MIQTLQEGFTTAAQYFYRRDVTHLRAAQADLVEAPTIKHNLIEQIIHMHHIRKEQIR
ncbi:hypothetical protein Sjap_000378 [Stephania japonica]|uniref:Uncharacterized protein n=1 Tax=Stephania japonica TaxID=461633 RepID=A0AAP0KJI2_9MAGN